MSDIADGVLYETTRPDTSSPWAAPRRIDELVLPGGRTEYPTESADGLELIFERTINGSTQLARTTRSALDAPFAPAEPLDVGFPTFRVGDPDLSRDGHVLMFVVSNGATGDFDIYQITR
jgi:hypothetical protein